MTTALTMDELRKTLRGIEASRRTVVVAPSQLDVVTAALADTPLVDVVASPVVEPGRAYVVNPNRPVLP